jgi:GNAT superfamily N-acetyltransferase
MNSLESKISYKMIDVSTLKELDRNLLSQVHTILQKEANWNDSFSDFKKNYTKRNFKNTKLFLIFFNKELAGFLDGWTYNKDHFIVRSFYVSSKYKNLKIGTKLRLRVLTHLRKLGFKKFIEGLVVNDLVKKIDSNIILKRKKASLKKDPKLTYPFSKKRHIFIRQKKGRK